MLLVVGAGLFVQTLMKLGRAPLGFRSHNLLLFSIQPPETRYPGAASTPLLQQLEGKLAAVPGVQAVTLSRVPLISGNAENHTFIPEGRQRSANYENNPSVLANEVGSAFLFDIWDSDPGRARIRCERYADFTQGCGDQREPGEEILSQHRSRGPDVRSGLESSSTGSRLLGYAAMRSITACEKM